MNIFVLSVQPLVRQLDHLCKGKDKDGNTPLHLASGLGNLQAIENGLLNSEIWDEGASSDMEEDEDGGGSDEERGSDEEEGGSGEEEEGGSDESGGGSEGEEGEEDGEDKEPDLKKTGVEEGDRDKKKEVEESKTEEVENDEETSIDEWEVVSLYMTS